MLNIDGSMGEGGGQILRSSLALSLCLCTPFRISNIRRERDKPGLRRQHLAAVQAAAALGEADVEGAELGSQALSFVPHRLRAGEHHFAIGTAGSTTLVLQTVLPALLTAQAPSRLVLEGGTHNPHAPPFDFLDLAFLPLINRMGPKIIARLERPGFYPAGGGLIHVEIKPVARLQPLDLLERGRIRRQYACTVVANLPAQIGQRELQVIGAQLGLDAGQLELRAARTAKGPGNVVTVTVQSEHVTEVFTGFGERGVRAETVAAGVVKDVQRYLSAGVPVGEHLADQLLLPFALAGGGSYLTLAPSSHATTNIAVIGAFLGTRIASEKIGPDAWRIRIGTD